MLWEANPIKLSVSSMTSPMVISSRDWKEMLTVYLVYLAELGQL